MNLPTKIFDQQLTNINWLMPLQHRSICKYKANCILGMKCNESGCVTLVVYHCIELARGFVSGFQNSLGSPLSQPRVLKQPLSPPPPVRRSTRPAGLPAPSVSLLLALKKRTPFRNALCLEFFFQPELRLPQQIPNTRIKLCSSVRDWPLYFRDNIL